MASDNECVAAFPRSPICQDRIYARVLSWAAYITAQPLPPTDEAPEKAWVQQRVTAEQAPALLSTGMMVQRLAPYLLETPGIQQKVRMHLSPWNNDADEATLTSDLDSAMAVVMPEYAAATVSDSEVANWCDRNGYPRPPDLTLPSFPPMP
jgi:hypothetical protein